MPKIVFVLNGIYKSRCIKRVEEFIDNGYDVDVYGFAWDNGLVNKSDKFDITVIGNQSESFSYYKRIGIIFRALRPLYKKYKGLDVVFYYFFLDVALGAFLQSRRKYIYEESDIPYLNVGNKLVKSALAFFDKSIIRHSLMTVMTSEGFIDFHFGNARPNNIVVVPNRVNPRIQGYPFTHKTLDMNHLSVGFVGGVRYDSIVNFAKVFVSSFPQFDFHVFGDIDPKYVGECNDLERTYPNYHYHGIFQNPKDLPGIYEQIDLVLATYDVRSINVLYAEPNKLYEAIYFHTPIIVSAGTFLSRKVSQLGVGYSIDALMDTCVCEFISSLTEESIMGHIASCASLPSEFSLNNNPQLFDYLSKACK